MPGPRTDVPLTPARQALAAAHVPLALEIAGRWARRCGISGMADELESAALFALCRVAADYDPARGAKFATFVGHRLNGEMQDALRRLHPGYTAARRKGRPGAAREARRVVRLSELEARRGGRRRDDPASCRPEFAAPDPFAAAESHDAVLGLLRGLPPRQGQVMRLLYLHAGTRLVRSAGARLGMSLPAVHANHRRAVAAIRERLGREARAS